MNNHINNKVTIEPIIELTERKNLRSKRFNCHNNCSLKRVSTEQDTIKRITINYF